MAYDFSWLPQGYAPSALPLGMRVNNPGNIKYFGGLNYPGMLGPSQHTDQGDPQMTFATPQAGMNAAASLAARKYRGGMRTARQLIAGQMGWTPGNAAAAGNIARSMGLSPDEDLRLDDPAQMTSFLKALTRQEHGGASNLYPDAYYRVAAQSVSGGPAPSPKAAPAARTSSQPQPLPQTRDATMTPSIFANLGRMFGQGSLPKLTSAAMSPSEIEAGTGAMSKPMQMPMNDLFGSLAQFGQSTGQNNQYSSDANLAQQAMQNAAQANEGDETLPSIRPVDMSRLTSMLQQAGQLGIYRPRRMGMG